MKAAAAHAKINLALLVGPRRPDGLHEVATLMQRLELADTVSVGPAEELTVEGFPEDTLVRGALEALAREAREPAGWRAVIDKQVPVAAGLGGGSSDAATALRLANDLLDAPLAAARLDALAAALGADVPFFLREGPQLATGSGRTLAPARIPQDFSVLVLLPHGEAKPSTASVYARFDGAEGFAERRARLLELLAQGERAALADLPGNDLARSPHSGTLRELGAFYAAVSGAGPAVYGLFATEPAALAAQAAVAPLGRSWVTRPAW